MHTDKYEGKVQKTFWLCNKDNSRAWSLKYRLIKSTRIGASQPYDVITVKNWCELLENFMFTVSPHRSRLAMSTSKLTCVYYLSGIVGLNFDQQALTSTSCWPFTRDTQVDNPVYYSTIWPTCWFGCRNGKARCLPTSDRKMQARLGKWQVNHFIF